MSFSFSSYVTFLTIFQFLQGAFLIFHIFQCFSPHWRSYPVFLIFFFVFQFYLQLTCPTVCISNFPCFSVFLAIFHGLQCVCDSYSPFSVFFFFSIFLVLQCAFLIFKVFQWSSTYFTSYTVCFSFLMIFSFLALLQVLQYAFLIFHVFQCFLPYPGQTVFVSSFPLLLVFLPYSRS